MDVGEDGFSRSAETTVRGRVYGTTPAALVEGVNLDGMSSEGREEVVVGVAVVAVGEVSRAIQGRLLQFAKTGIHRHIVEKRGLLVAEVIVWSYLNP